MPPAMLVDLWSFMLLVFSNVFVRDELIIEKIYIFCLSLDSFGHLTQEILHISLFLFSLLTSWKLVGLFWGEKKKKVLLCTNQDSAKFQSTSDDSWWVIFGLCQSNVITKPPLSLDNRDQLSIWVLNSSMSLLSLSSSAVFHYKSMGSRWALYLLI